ncbi:MAG TPA: nitroreductase family protein [Desulfonatronum sp.]|nr:nitroreductase family protein [Desulfonatronum sp.]
MTLRELVSRTRSYRRFYENHALSLGALEELVDTARLTASAANLQPLRYILSVDPSMNARIFPLLSWAAYLKDWSGPDAGERPAGYIILMGDVKHLKTAVWDMGIAAQTILLSAMETGIGGCMIGSVQKTELAELLQVPEGFEILLSIALGKPKEKVVLEQMKQDGDVRYWRDNKGTHHVPKRDLESIVLGRYGEK